jgi:hypothetical protein
MEKIQISSSPQDELSFFMFGVFCLCLLVRKGHFMLLDTLHGFRGLYKTYLMD